jgi:hypothetical protein
MRHAKRALAASFVMTFAAGCDSKENAPPAAPTVDVGTGTPAPASATAAAAPAATPTPTANAAGATGPAPTATAWQPTTLPTVAPTASGQAKLPPAPPTGNVVRQADGTCVWHANVICPKNASGRPIPCNPPRPHEVECPPDAGAATP